MFRADVAARPLFLKMEPDPVSILADESSDDFALMARIAVGDHAAFRELQPARDQREDRHHHEGTQHRPSDADGRLLVADEDVPPGEEIEQFTVAPEVAPVLALRSARFDDEFRFQHGCA